MNFTILEHGDTICGPDWGMTQECACFYRFYYVEGGSAYEQKRDRAEKLEPGFLYLFPVMEPYTLFHDAKDPFQVLWFHIDTDFEFCIQPTRIEIGQDSELYYLLQAIRKIQDQPESFAQVETLFGVFLERIRGHLFFYHSRSKWMLDVLTFVEEHIGLGLKVGDMAKQAGMERSYFTRKFKSELGIGPGQFLLSRRMKRAANALIGGATVEQAAAESGYQDEKAFSRAFHAYMEITPGAYRRSHILQP